MCYSAAVSLRAFFVNAAGSAALFSIEPAAALFFAFVGLMQLFDFLFWTHQDDADAAANRAITKAAMVANHLQPVVLALLVWLYAGTRAGSLGRASWAVTAAYVAAAALYTGHAWRRVGRTRVRPDTAPGLKWDWNHQPGARPFYLLFLVAFCVLMFQGFAGALRVALLAFTLVSFAVSMSLHRASNATGRFWCHYAAFAPALLFALLVIAR